MKIEKSKLLVLIQSLSPEELKLIKLAVDSPFFNYRNEEKNLFSYIIKYKDDVVILNDFKKLYRYVFKNDELVLSKLRNVMSYLTKIILRVMTIIELEEENNQVALLRFLRKKDLSKYFLQEYIASKINTDSKLSSKLYYNNLQLRTEYYTHSIIKRKAMDIELLALSEDLDLYYVTQKLKQVGNIISYKNMFKSEHELELLDEVLALINRKKLNDNPLIKILLSSYNSMLHPEEEEHFYQLKESLMNYVQNIDINELKDLYILAINYCIKKINTGNKAYFYEIFEIYKLGLKNDILEENGKISPYTFKNIVSIAIGIEQYDWLAVFLEEYENKILGEFAKDFYTYSLARFYFALKKYDEAMDLLQEMDIKETFTDLDTRILIIKIYYELKEFDLIDYTISNLKQQLQRKNLQTYHQETYKNFLKWLQKIIKSQHHNKLEKKKMVKSIEEETILAEKPWLLSIL